MSVNVNALTTVTELNTTDLIPAVIAASNEGRAISAANLAAQVAEINDNGPVRESFTFNGLTITAVRTGGCVQLTISGTLTADLAVASTYVQVCTLSEEFRKATYGSAVWYIWYNSNTYGQIRIATDGVVSLGHARGNDGASKNLTSGSAIYCATTFPGRTVR